MVTVIRPRRINWPTAFWARAEGSWIECDLVCRDCLGNGCQVFREDAWEGVTAEDVACPACRGSGLLVQAREMPDDHLAVWAAEAAGGGWLDWIGHTGDGLIWPASWAWTVSRRRFAIRRDVYLGGKDVLAIMVNGSVVMGLLKLDEGSRGRLEMVFRLACGEDAEMPGFVMP